MKAITIGNITFKPIAIKQIVLCLFLNGVVIGGMVAYKQNSGKSFNVFIIFALVLLPYLILRKEISKNIFEHNDKDN